MLELGVELYEVSGTRVKKNRRANLFGASLGRLHAKLAVVDKKTIFVGSMNLDPRSATINTELGAVITSPELAREMIRIIDLDRLRSAYRLRLNKEGTACEWVSVDDDDEEIVITEEPDSTFWLRLKTILLRPLVPESLL
jgi:putative cardiolipin synthase